METRNAFRTISTLTLLLCAALAWAQQDPAFVHYWDLEPQFNPAAAGRSDLLSINVAYQSHAMGYEDAGGTMYAGADMAFQLGRTRHGAGAFFQNDKIGLFSHLRFAVQYSYHFKLFGGRLSIGAQADMLQESISGSKADPVETADDPAIPKTDVEGSRFDVSAGLYYAHKRWYAGLGALHLTAPTIRVGETNEYAVKRLYNFTAGYNIKFRNPLLTIVPSVMMRYDGTAFRADLTGRVIYARESKRLYAGASYSPQHSATLFIGGMFHGVDISYAYEANTSGMGLGAGQHEVTLSYRLPLNLEKKGKNMHKSVRYL
ncbi:MAG: PorP/SprF family type IX secretion system membrane protein [Alloprevotella sp.]|nr:PorP/SprF family type IX secretion system membrane protein [Alloprevotella sp.]